MSIDNNHAALESFRAPTAPGTALNDQAHDLMLAAYKQQAKPEALQNASHLDIPALPAAGGACKIDDPCMKFCPDPTGKGAHAEEWREENRALRHMQVETDPQGKYEVKPGDCIESIARRLAEQRGNHAPGAVGAIEKELLGVNQHEHPKLGCNPHYLRPGMKLDIPPDPTPPHKGDTAPLAQKPGATGEGPEDRQPGGQNLIGRGPEKRTAQPSDEPPSTLDVAPGGKALPDTRDVAPGGKTLPDAGDVTSVGKVPPDKHDVTPDPNKDKPGEGVCKIDSDRALIDKLKENGKNLSPAELDGAIHIIDALRNGNEQGVKDVVGQFQDHPESLNKIADALRPTLKDSGIDVWSDHLDDLKSGKSTPFLQFYREGADKDISIAARGDEVGAASMSNGHIIFFGPALIGGKSDVMKDLQKALKKDCA